MKQGTEELPEVPVFSFEVDNIKETSLEFSIFPADKEMTYIGSLMKKVTLTNSLRMKNILPMT